MPKPPYEFDDFLEKVAGYRYELRKERQVKAKVKAALSCLGAATFNLIQVVGEQYKEGEDNMISQAGAGLITADLIDDAVLIKSGKRRLTFMIMYGVGSDRELPGAKHERCGQIGAYVHLIDQSKAVLGARLCIYGSGDVSDGVNTWSINDGVDGFMPFLVKCINDYIFQMDLYWKKTKDLDRQFNSANVDEGEIVIDDLRRTAVSFSVEERDRSLDQLNPAGEDLFLTGEHTPFSIEDTIPKKPPQPDELEPKSDKSIKEEKPSPVQERIKEKN